MVNFKIILLAMTRMLNFLILDEDQTVEVDENENDDDEDDSQPEDG